MPRHVEFECARRSKRGPLSPMRTECAPISLMSKMFFKTVWPSSSILKSLPDNCADSACRTRRLPGRLARFTRASNARCLGRFELVGLVHAATSREAIDAATTGTGDSVLRPLGSATHTLPARACTHVARSVVRRVRVPLRNRVLADASINNQLHFSVHAGWGRRRADSRSETNSSPDSYRGCSHARGSLRIGNAGPNQGRFASRAGRCCGRTTWRRAVVDSSRVPAAGRVHATGRLPSRTYRSLRMASTKGTKSLYGVVKRVILSTEGRINRVLGSFYSIVSLSSAAKKLQTLCLVIGKTRIVIDFRNPLLMAQQWPR